MKMNNMTRKLKNVIGLCTGLLILGFAVNSPAQSKTSGNVKVTILPLVKFINGMPSTEKVAAAGASLSRNNDGVFFTLHTQGLTPGDAVTAWMAVFNNPSECATNPCTPADFANPAVNGTLLNSGGRVIGIDGAATYGGFRGAGDTTGARPNVGTGNGLVDVKGAQIHLVLRSHGTANLMDPVILSAQLSMFFGGCPMGVGCSNVQDVVFEP